MILDTNSAKAPNIIIHKKSAVRLSNGPFSSWTPYLTLSCNYGMGISSS